MMLTAGTELYGNLPLFPCLDYLPVTEERVERAVERLFNSADAIFLKGGATQAQYDAWSARLAAWSAEQYEKVGPFIAAEFYGRGDAFFGGKADDRVLDKDGSFRSACPRDQVQEFASKAAALAAAELASNRRAGGLLSAFKRAR